MMRTSQEGIELIKKFEGFKPVVYLDPVGIPTAAYGHTAGLTIGMVGKPVSKVQAEQWLKEDLVKFEKKVNKYDSIYHWSENEFSSLVSFAYNIGSIDGLTVKGTRSKKEIADAMLNYNKAGGRVLNGLTRRREAERELFLGKAYKSTPATSIRPVLRRGAQGKAVGELQGLLGLKQDCIFGCLTETAVRLFQKEHGLVEDGIVGAVTWRELLKNGK